MNDTPMALRVLAGNVDDFAEESISQVDAGGIPIALYRLSDTEFRATSDVCTHGQAFLSEGWLADDGQVECPLHGGCFDIRTGQPTGLPCEIALRTYPVEVIDGEVFIIVS